MSDIAVSTKVLFGLHRPFHQPLWIVKWVCVFFVQRSQQKDGCFYVQDVTADFYFVMLDWLNKGYPRKYASGIPSKDAVSAVREEFSKVNKSERFNFLKSVMTKQNRVGVEKQIYSTYKSAGYYINLAKEKLHLVNSGGEILETGFPTNNRKVAVLTRDEKYCLVRQILKYDSFLFLAMCLLQRDANERNLNLEKFIYDFLMKYYPVSRVNYISRSLHNYYVVRKSWIDLLNAITKSGKPSKMVLQAVNSMPNSKKLFNEINSHIKDYRKDLGRIKTYQKRVDALNKAYNKIIAKQEAINDFVNLYDICEEMQMSYKTFNVFLSQYYEQEHKNGKILLTNIVATIEPRKRFYVRNIPVIKIKILK